MAMTETAPKETGGRGPSKITVFRGELVRLEDQFKAALPAHISAERFSRVVATAVQNNPELLECDRQSLWREAMRCAQDGLMPDGREAALTVRRSGGAKVASYLPMIAGIRKKARNSGEIATWDVHIVRDGDVFQFQLGDNPQINHTFDLRTERGDVIGGYSVCTLKSGEKSYEVMTTGEINAIRDRSDAWRAYKANKIKSTPWQSDYAEMAKKTIARRHSKVLPASTDLDDLLRRDDEMFNGSPDQEAADAPKSKRTLANRLDALAGPPANTIEGNANGDGKPAPAEKIDEETGEIEDAPSDVEDIEPEPQAAELSWTEKHCRDHGRKAFAQGRTVKAAIPAPLAMDAERSGWIRAGYEAARAEKEEHA